MKPIVTIVGQANVGKSTLFNRLLGRRRAIVHDRPGVTRDRIFAASNVNGSEFWLVDTGGMWTHPKGEMVQKVDEQILMAAEEADVLLTVFDARKGLTTLDEEIVSMLRPLGKPFLGVVNKLDPKVPLSALSEFQALGLENILGVSAEHNLGIADLRAMIKKELDPIQKSNSEDIHESSIRVAFMGRPNVGKSSLINCILDEKRLIVSEVPGTTRDVIDTPIQQKGKSYLLLDTAGLRKRSKRSDELEQLSTMRALRTVGRSDVVVLVLSGLDHITTQDERIAAAVIEQGAGLLLLVNKWDLIKDTPNCRKLFRQDLYAKASFLKFAGVRYVSAKTGLGMSGILSHTYRIWKNLHAKHTKNELRPIFEEIQETHPVPGKLGFQLRLHSLTAADERIPTFFIWCSNPQVVTTSFARYWENALRDRMGLEGVPLRVVFRRKEASKKASRRRSAKTRRNTKR